MVKKANKFIMVILITSVCLLVFSACNNAGSPSDGNKGKVVVGGKDSTEQVLLTKLTAMFLEEHGYEAEEKSGMGSTVVRTALENGQVDFYWEYTGTALVVFHKEEAVSDPEEAYNTVKEIDEQNDIIWLDKSEINNTYVIIMREEAANELGLETVSDFANYVNDNPGELKLATTPEFYGRDDGLPGLQKAYDFQMQEENVVQMDSGLLYDALRDEQVDAASGFATDGRIKGFNLVGLEDDQAFFPVYNATPVIRKNVLNEDEELGDLLNELAHRFNDEAIISLNHAVDIEHQDATDVAREWLISEGLIEE